MHIKYNVALASVIGSEHTRLGLNNQDALLVTNTEDYVFGVVSDGCGSCHRSEVGAALMTRLAANLIPSFTQKSPAGLVESNMQLARHQMVWALKQVIQQIAPLDPCPPVNGLDTHGWHGCLTKESDTIASCFLATLVGFCIFDDYAFVFSMGDGFYAVNGKVCEVDEDHPSHNAPAYLAYHLLPGVSESYPAAAMEFCVRVFPTQDINTLMIGTDGVRFLMDNEAAKVPGKSNLVGPLSQLWEDKMFLNHDMMRRRLSMLNKDVHLPDWQAQSMIVCPSILKDDTTVISIKKAN